MLLKLYILILQAGSVDMTNLITNVNPSEYSEYFKQEAIISANHFFTAGQNALINQPTLKKVVLMKHIPRYDPPQIDPLGLKPALSQLFNNTITELWMNCPNKEKLVIGSHNIDCSGAIKESRYRQPKTGRFDGIHLLGNSGQKAYTLSVLNILKLANLTSSQYDYHQSYAQFQYQSKEVRNKNKSRSNKNQNQPEFQIPTSNRFNIFSSQGNL